MGWECSAAEPPRSPEFESPPCAVCGGDRRMLVASARDLCVQRTILEEFVASRLTPSVPPAMLADKTRFTQDYLTDIVACADCGLLYRCPRPQPEKVLSEYARDRYGYEKLEALFQGEIPFYRRKVASLRHRLPRGARVLEVGSFVGAFLDAARVAGWEALGVDVGEEVTAYARGRGLKVLQTDLPHAALPPESMDAVFIWNCFDQIPEPWPVLRKARELLRPGGLLVIRVPNGDAFRLGTKYLIQLGLGFRRYQLTRIMALNNLLTFPYLYGYTGSTLRRALSECGLRVEGFVGSVLVNLADRYTRPWAAEEEILCKRSTRILSNLIYTLSGRRLLVAPWIEVFATKLHGTNNNLAVRIR